MPADSKQKLSTTTVVLHWLVGLGIIMLMIVGFYMSQTESYNLYPVHKSVGAIMLIFILWRLVWRIMQGPLTPVSQYKGWEIALAKVVIVVLLIGTLLFPVSGMMMSYFGGHGLQIFGLELAAQNLGMDGKPAPINASLAGIGHETHEYLLPIMGIAILLHIAGAYKHHFADKDGTLKRMLGKRVD